MKGSYFRVMLVCGAASIGLLVLGTATAQQPWVAMVGGVLPLMYYHLAYLAPQARKGRLGQSAVDSVYYFGFLVTVAALSISAITVAVQGAAEAHLQVIVYQFGAGLLATAYAVIARMHLSSLATVLDATSPEALMDRYMKRSLELVHNAEAASATMHTYVQMVVQRTGEFDAATRNRTERLIVDTAAVFAREMKATLDDTRQGLREIQQTTRDLAVSTTRANLIESVGQLARAVKGTTVALEELAAQSRRSVQNAKEATISSDVLDSALKKLQESVIAFGGEDGALPRSVEAISAASHSLEGGLGAMDATVTSLKEAADYMQSAGPAFQAMRSVAKKAQTQIQALEHVANQLEGAIAPIGAAATNIESLAGGLNDLAAVLPPLTAQTTSLGVELGRAGTFAQKLNIDLEGLGVGTQALAGLGGQVQSALAKVAEGVRAVVDSVGGLNGSAIDVGKLNQALSLLVGHAVGLQKAISGVESGLNGLASAAQGSGQALGASTAALSATMNATSEQIGVNLRRSTQAAGMLTERLVEVAEGIITRTREQQGAIQ